MTLGKKLYLNFGFILGMVLLLFLVNYLAVEREHSAKDAAAKSLKMSSALKHCFQQIQPAAPDAR